MEIYDQFIATKLKDFMLEEEMDNKHEKKSFWATDSEKPLFDLYHAWIGTKPTNPPDAEKLVMFSAGKMMEIALVNTLQRMGLARKGEQKHFDITRENIIVTGYTDIIFEDGTIGEVKTYANDFLKKELQKGYPTPAYLKQLAIYLDAHGQDKGKLIFMDRRDGGLTEFTLLRTDKLNFECLNVSFNLEDTYKRWADLYNNHVLPEVEPSPFECGKYKEDIEKIDWTKISKTNISKARTGKKVIGSMPSEAWKILYSPYKDILLERQNVTPGYTDSEIKRIVELTKGYSSNKY